MNITELQKKTIQAIVNIFETGRVLGEYGQVTFLKGDSGGLTYGRSQTTLMSGNLALLIEDYIEAKGNYINDLKGFLPALINCQSYLNNHTVFKELLRKAGDDPIMHQVQDAFFDRLFWQPTLNSAKYIKAELPLSVAVIYDSHIHGNYFGMKKQVNDQYGECKNIGEKLWIKRYVATRKDWLGTHSNKLLHKTIYRMETFEQLISKDEWTLDLPLFIRGIVIDEETLNSNHQSIRVAAVDDNMPERVLFLTKGVTMRGKDVKMLQEALGIYIDGKFGPETEQAVKDFQAKHGLKVDGKVGPVTWAKIMES